MHTAILRYFQCWLQPVVSSIMSLCICACVCVRITWALLTISVTVNVSEVRCAVLVAVKSALDYVWHKVVVRVRVEKVADSITICKKKKSAIHRNVQEISTMRLLHTIGP